MIFVFSIYVDGLCIHDNETPMEECKVVGPTLKLADNAAGSLEFTMPTINLGYGNGTDKKPLVKRMASTVEVFKKGSLYWEGRVLNEAYDFYNNRKFYCEGALAYLNDTCQPNKTYHDLELRQLFEAIIGAHNDKSDEKHSFTVGSVEFSDIVVDTYELSMESTYTAISNLIASYGGHLRIRYVNGTKYIDWLENYPQASAQRVEFGVNLLEYTKSIDLSNLCTVVLPVGAKVPGKGTYMVGAKSSLSKVKGRIVKAGGVGDEVSITPTSGAGIVKRDGEVIVKTDLHTKYKLAEISVAPGDIYYYTGAQDSWLGMILFKDANDGFVSSNKSKYAEPSSKSKTSLAEYKIVIPDDATKLVVGWNSNYANGLRLNAGATGYGVITDPRDETHKIAIASVTSGNVYYYTGRQNNANGMYAFLDQNDNVISTSGTYRFADADGFTDLIESKITAPANAAKIVVGGYTEGIAFRVNRATQITEETDIYLTVQDASRNADHTVYVRNKNLIDTYGWIEKKIEWSEDEKANTLYTHAVNYLNSQFDNIKIEITAVDLNLLGIDTAPITILDKLEIVSIPHGLPEGTYYPITEMEIPLAAPEQTKYVIGYTEEVSITSSMASMNDSFTAKIDTLPSVSKTLESARDQASAMIKTAMGGYVTAKHDANGQWTELLISDVPPYDSEGQPVTTAKVWRWNYNGLGFSSTGPEGSFGAAAITADGKIVADAITAGTMTADRIRGGTLTLGGANNVNGTLVVKNSSGSNIITLDRTGADINGSVKASQGYGWATLTRGQLFAGYDNEPPSGVDPTDYATGIVSPRARVDRGGQYDPQGRQKTSLGIRLSALGKPNGTIITVNDVEYSSDGKGMLILSANDIAVSLPASQAAYCNMYGEVSQTGSKLTVVTDLYFQGDDLMIEKRELTYRLGFLMGVGDPVATKIQTRVGTS